MRKASKVKTPYNDHRSQWVTFGEYKEAKKTGGSIYASKDGSNPVSVEDLRRDRPIKDTVFSISYNQFEVLRLMDLDTS
jgi:hypothetical protein